MTFYKFFNWQPIPTVNINALKWEPRNGCGADCAEPQQGKYKGDVFEKSRKWYDILATTEPVIKLWSERVKHVVEEQELVGLEFYPVEFDHFEDKRLLKHPVPRFYIAKYSRGVPATPYLEDGITPCRLDFTTGLYDLGPFFGVQKYVFDFSRWDGADFFYISTVYTAHRFCTQRFKDLVDQHKLTNFVFHGARNEAGTEFLV